MSTLSLDLVTSEVRSLPALPLVVQELLQSMGRDDVDVAEIARKIALDPGLTARALRLANSSFYGLANQVNTMQEAIAVLGLRTIRSVVTTAALLGAFVTDPNSSFNINAFWRHALGVALCARELAPSFKLNPEHAYTTGLLHDVGQLVLVTRFTNQYAGMLDYRLRQDCSLVDAERHVLKIDHAQVGHLLTQHWKFPVAMQEAVGGHHLSHAKDIHPLGMVLFAANAIAHGLDLSLDEDDCVPVLPPAFWRQTGLHDDDLLRIFSRVEQQFTGASLILDT